MDIDYDDLQYQGISDTTRLILLLLISIMNLN